jgi:hypothetical protein
MVLNFTAFWRQRISSAVAATNAAFVNRIPQRDTVLQQYGSSIAKATPHPRFYNCDPELNRGSINHRNPISPQHSFSLGVTDFGFSFFSFFYCIKVQDFSL